MTLNLKKSVDKEKLLPSIINMYGLISNLQYLTEKEMELYCLSLSLPERHLFNPFSTQARKILREKMGVSERHLNNLIYILEKKGYITKDEDNFFNYPSFLLKIRDKDIIHINVTYQSKETPENTF